MFFITMPHEKYTRRTLCQRNWLVVLFGFLIAMQNPLISFNKNSQSICNCEYSNLFTKIDLSNAHLVK